VQAAYADPQTGATSAVTVRAPRVVVACGSLESPALLLRSGIASGNGSIVRLLIITLVGLALATWRLGRMRPIGSDD